MDAAAYLPVMLKEGAINFHTKAEAMGATIRDLPEPLAKLKRPAFYM